MWFRNQEKGAIFRPCLAAFCVAVIAFPSNVFADAITFTYQGGDHSYSDPAAWTCSPSCTGAFPDNVTDGSVDAVINSGQPDNVLLNTPSTLTSLGLGGSGASAQSTLIVSGPPLILGSSFDPRQNVLTIGNGGVLNIDGASGGAVLLDMTAGNASISAGGAIHVTNAGSLVLSSTFGGAVTNAGSIGLENSSLTLADGGQFGDFHFAGGGAINLSNGHIAGTVGGEEGLFNDENHTIAGNGSLGASYFSNNGTLRASGGTLAASNLASLSSGDLSSGTYVVDNGATLQLSAYDGNNFLSYIDQGASVTVNGNGLLTLDGTTNALQTVSGVAGNLTLQNGASLTADPAQITGFTSYGGLGGGTVSVLSGSSLDLSPVTFYNAESSNLTGGFSIGDHSTITYSGPDINYIDPYGSLTLAGDGHFVNLAGGDLQSTLHTVNGALTLEDGAVFVSGTPTFRADTASGAGYVTVRNGSTLDLTSTQWENEGSGTLQFGDFEIGADSVVKYSGNDISTIEETASLTLDGNGALVNTLSANSDPLSSTLTTVNGTLALDQGASLTPNAGTFTVGPSGSVTLDHGSTLDLGGVTFTNESGGVLSSGLFAVGDASTLRYSGNDLNTIGSDAVLGLSGSGKVVNANGGDHDAVSNTLATVNGTLILDQGASLTLTNQFTNNGLVGLSRGSSLFVGPDASSNPVSVTNNWDGTNSNSSGSECGCADGALFGLQNSSATISGDFNNTSNTYSQYSEFSAQVELLDQSTLTVNGNFTNDSSDGAGNSALTLDFGSTATVNGLLSNLGNSLVDLDYLSTLDPGVSGGSTLNANGGFLNSNSGVYLENGSTLNVSLPNEVPPSAAGQQQWAFRNLSEDITYSYNYAQLQVGSEALVPTFDSNSEPRYAPSVANISGGLLNAATSIDGGHPTSAVTVDGGSTLNADVILNLATASGGGEAFAGITVANGSTLNVTTPDQTGVLTNSAYASGAGAYADVNITGGSTLIADSVVNSFTSSNGGEGAATISIDGSTMIVNNTFNNTGGVLNLMGRAQVTVKGQFTNDANSVVSLDGYQVFASLHGADALNGSILNTNGFSNSGEVSLNQESAINNTGAFENSGSVTIDNHSALNVTPHDGESDGSLTNTGSITTGDSGGGGNQITVQGDVFNTAPGVINLRGESDQMTVAGQFNNAGDVTVGSGATIQAETYVQTEGHTTIETSGTIQANLDLKGGTLSGDGTIVGDVKVDGGTLSPGDPQSIDIIGNYEETLLGVLDLDFAGAGDGEYDQITVMSDDQHPDGGNVLLGGTLNLTLENGFGLGVDIGTLFHILTWTGERLDNSDFNVFHNQTFSNGTKLLTFREVFGDHGLDLAVIDASVATPEPSTVSMLFGVMLLAGGAVWLRRRRNGIG